MRLAMPLAADISVAEMRTVLFLEAVASEDCAMRLRYWLDWLIANTTAL